MEKLLVCDALDERDFLRKRINDAIRSLKVVGAKRVKDNKVDGRTSVEDFNKAAQSDYQSIKDLIKRYQDIDIAITDANAKTEIELKSGRRMTRAGAIALRKSLLSNGTTDFTGMLINTIERQFKDANAALQTYNRKADSELESYKNGLINRDSSKRELTEKEIEMANAMVKDLYGEFIDPIGAEAELGKLHDTYDTLLKQIETAIKISNATTYIEF